MKSLVLKIRENLALSGNTSSKSAFGGYGRAKNPRLFIGANNALPKSRRQSFSPIPLPARSRQHAAVPGDPAFVFFRGRWGHERVRSPSPVLRTASPPVGERDGVSGRLGSRKARMRTISGKRDFPFGTHNNLRYEQTVTLVPTNPASVAGSQSALTYH